MEINELIKKRRSYRDLIKIDIDPKIIKEAVYYASLAPSCFNNQPWRVLACNSKDSLNLLKDVYSKGNEWCYNASSVLIIWSKKDFDCIIKDRIYYSFDCGIFVGYLTLIFEDLGYVAHPIAGFSPKKVRELFKFDDNADIITLIIIGKKRSEGNNKIEVLSYDQIEREKERPQRKEIDEILKIV